jgi:hypothetical protein
VAVLIDSTQAFSASEMTLVKRVVDVANKWDLVDDKFKKKAVKWMDK